MGLLLTRRSCAVRWSCWLSIHRPRPLPKPLFPERPPLNPGIRLTLTGLRIQPGVCYQGHGPGLSSTFVHSTDSPGPCTQPHPGVTPSTSPSAHLSLRLQSA